MADNRKGLTSGYELNLGIEKTFIIIEEIGRGSSCIVYSASYKDSTNLEHSIRIKECYPYNIGIIRADHGKLKCPSQFENTFKTVLEEFYESYKRNVELRNTLGLMNSIIDSIDILEKNNTWYIVMSCAEGKDYRFETDDSLQSVFIRMKTLAKIIKKYHDAGILYLDIKPENILIIPETKEHMVLFDFGTLITLEEIKSKKEMTLSYSNGFAAPELVRGKREKLCEATDIYSFGAIVFLKIFGRTPNILECSLGADYDFATIRYTDERYQPELFRRLNVFLHKTLSVLPYRYKTMDELIESIDEMIELSDVEDVFLVDNFSYHSEFFVGRRKEMTEILATLDKKQSIFLSGIGGIGKTEIVKRFAFDFREKYGKIIFLPFSNTIQETICTNDLNIHGIQREDEEEDIDYFNRKIEVLKSITTKKDLIILDNFDVELDDNLENLLECPCKFLITTREDYSDYNYTQIEISRMQDIQEIWLLFQTYSKNDYDKEEIREIEDIIELVDRHTMSVELIAKYLRIMEESPGNLLAKMKEKEGITSTEEVDIKHRKDKKIRVKSVNKHLLLLFDLSMFSDNEYELIKSLALLGYVRVNKSRFLECCDMDHNEQGLERLIKRGWIEYDEDSGKISLHQIILDLVYNYLKPTSEQCPHIVKAITGYIEQKTNTYMELDIKRKVVNSFVERVTGRDIHYAVLLVAYCNDIGNKVEYLIEAEEISNRLKNKKSMDLLRKISVLKIKKASNYSNLFEEDIEEEEYFREKALTIVQWAMSALYYGEETDNSNEAMSDFCIELSWILVRAAEEMGIYLYQREGKGLKIILDVAEQILHKGEAHLEKLEMNHAYKIKQYKKIQSFYSQDDLNDWYRCENYGDSDKLLHYQSIIDNLRKENEDNTDKIYVDSIVYSECGDSAMEEKDYNKAIEYYEKAFEEGEIYDWILPRLSRAYREIGNMEKAVGLLETVLDIDMKNHTFSSYICYDLIDLLITKSRLSEARKYADKMIWYNLKEIEEEETAYSLSWVLAGLYYLYQIETEEEEKKKIWDKCILYYKSYEKYGEVSDCIVGFLKVWADHIEEKGSRIQFAISIGMKYKREWEKSNSLHFFQYAIKESDGFEGYSRDCIVALLHYTEVLCEDYSTENAGMKALEYGYKAVVIYENERLKDEYLKSRIHKVMGQCYSKLDESRYDKSAREKRKCNFYLLAKCDGEGLLEEERVELWKEAAEEYGYLDDYVSMERCYEELFGIWKSCSYERKGYQINTNWFSFKERIRGLIEQGEQQKVFDLLAEAYEMLGRYFVGESIGKNGWNEEEEFDRRLEDMADDFDRIGCEKEAIAFYMLSLIVMIEPRMNIGFLNRIKLYSFKDMDGIFEKFVKVIHEEMPSGRLDKVMSILRKLDLLVDEEKDDSWFLLKRELEWFSSAYQHREFEFKR